MGIDNFKASYQQIKYTKLNANTLNTLHNLKFLNLIQRQASCFYKCELVCGKKIIVYNK